MKKEFESIMKQKTDSRQEKITFSMVKKAISTMKKGKQDVTSDGKQNG